ncbi:MAG TPA: phosphoribosylamine--glycine ligase [Vicinamibacteria bacterium]|jgi:phosphoribosylamine--glycine ligase|nr:phosphoribosylamine--glycine ligase [Vicinamibacteria bacterium]
MKILVVGNGGREHALVWKIRQSPLVKDVYCAPGNAGMTGLADCVPIDTSNIIEVADFAQTISADLTVVGPELPMVLGIGDEFQRRGLSIFCPSRSAAEIEGSKAFAREFMNRHQIPSPQYVICSSREEADEAVKKGTLGYPLVLKVDGLAAGKGVVVVEDKAEAQAAVAEMMSDKKFGTAGAKLILEEFLPGEEVSFLVFSDGARVVPMVSVQDHKRVGDGDTGSNTGGMGTVSPSTSLSLDMHKQIMQEIILPTIGGLSAEGRRYQGVLYAGLMVTEKGPRVLEFNARFGDPETQVIMARMRSDIVPILQGVAEGQLKETKIDWAKEAAVCVVVTARGYPDAPETGDPISGLEALQGLSDVMVFHAATARRDDKVVTVGGRVLGVTALGANLDAAVQRAYGAVKKVSFEGMHYRKDIGQKALARLHAPR